MTESFIQLDAAITLRDICYVNDTSIFLCGGMPGKMGCIWQSTDGGSGWNRIVEMPDRCIYDVDFFDLNNGYAGGDDLLLLHTTDGGKTWENVFRDHDFSQWLEFVRPIRKVCAVSRQTTIAVGGDTYNKGVICSTWNWGQNWSFSNFDNQLNDIQMVAGQHSWIAGYGLIFASSDSCHNLETLDTPEDHFTALDFRDNNTGLACGYNGGIYLTRNGGTTWESVMDDNSAAGQRRHLNDIAFAGNHNAFAVGNNGLTLYSNDAGESWIEIQRTASDDLLCVYPINESEILACGANGRIYRIRLK